MKLKLLKNLMIASKYMIYVLTLQILILQIVVANSTHGQGTKSVEISIEVENASLSEIFSIIKDQTDYVFSYPENIDEDKERFSLKYKKVPVTRILDELTKKGNLQFKQVNNNISVVKAPLKEKAPKYKESRVDKEIKGKVTDSNTGDALIGANVLVKGTDNLGVITDIEGNFSISIPEETQVLLVSFIGYKTSEVTIGVATNLSISLAPDISALQEVLVIGYGSQERGDVTTSVSHLSVEKIKELPVAGFDQAVVGRLAGVQASQTSGIPGGNISIRVRGTSSITAGNNPLIVVDGIPLSDETSSGFGSTSRDYVEQPFNPLATIDINDIASIEVLKDASSAAIYGSRGSNGVVLITTNKGTAGEPTISYNTYFGVQKVLNKIDMLSAREFSELHADAKNNAYLGSVTGANASDDNATRTAKANADGIFFGVGEFHIPAEVQLHLDNDPDAVSTDWQDEIFNDATMQYHNVSISGGTDELSYFASANYLDQDGIVSNSGYKRYGARLNLEGKLNKRLKFGFRVNPSIANYDLVDSEGPLWDEGVIASALSFAPVFPVKNDDGTFNDGMTEWWLNNFSFDGLGEYTIANPVELINKVKDEMTISRTYSSAFLDFQLLEGLTYRISTGAEFNDIRRDYFHPTQLDAPVWWYGFSGANYAYSSSTKSVNWLVENIVSYEKTINDHKISAIVGNSAQKENIKFSEAFAGINDIPNDLVPTLNAATNIRGNTREEEWSLLSYLARVQYNFKSKYYLSAAVRTDGSSRFGKGNKWGTFPSFSAGWRVSDESFMAGSEWLSDFKIRGSYGVTGNFQIPNYGAISLVGESNYVLGADDGATTAGLAPISPANGDLSWERTSMTDIGFDLSLNKSKIEIQFDYYNSLTSDLLLNVPIPGVSGFTTVLQNVGEVSNKGIEISTTIREDFGKFFAEASFNYSRNTNRVEALGTGGNSIIFSSARNNDFITQVGEEIGSYYTLLTDGVFMDQADVDANPSVSGAQPGDYKFVDINNDGQITPEDRTITGSYQPDYTFGISTLFKYQNLDLNILVQGVQGVEIINTLRDYIGLPDGSSNVLGEFRNRYISASEPGSGSTLRATSLPTGSPDTPSSAWIEDGSYIAVRNITLGYTFGNVLKNTPVSSARIYTSIQNPFLFTDYTGYNPEISSRPNNALAPGEDLGTYPLSKTFTVGLNVKF